MGIAQKIKSAIKRPLYAYQRERYLKNPTGLRTPDFIGIGSGQAGSTWMFKNFQAHPGIFVANKKETHYFSTAFDDWPFSYYCSLFADAGDKICGEMTPAYLLITPQRIAQVRKLVPDARLIMTIRNPIERGWSGARRTMSNLAKADGRRVEDVPDEEFYAYFEKEWDYRPERNDPGEYTKGMLQGHYCQAMDQWLEHFPEEQLLITFFDHIKHQPKQLMQRVCQHIGASVDIDWEDMPLSKVVNKNPSMPMPDKYRAFLTDLYQPEIEELRRRFGTESIDWLK